jgi:isopentenyl diphosphate isomerase/L-lactate dehydrogenase-like FMN-dependent dehydrogenase
LKKPPEAPNPETVCEPEIVDAVDGKVEVYVDSGIRRGTDVLKAIACGARAERLIERFARRLQNPAATEARKQRTARI